MYGISSRNKADFTTIALSQFLLNNVDFESILVIKNTSEIPNTTLTRLSNVSGKIVSLQDSGTELFSEMNRLAACSPA